MSRINCEHCNALVTPGASFCLACFLPFDDAPAAAPYATPPAAAPYAAVPGYPTPAAPPPPPPGDGGFFAATAAPAHPGEQGDWRFVAPQAALQVGAARRRPRSNTPKVVAAVVGVLVLVGLVAGGRALLAGPSEKQELARAFREARPPDLLPALPELGSLTTGLDDEPEVPGQAKAFVASIDPKIRSGNDAILAMQATMDRWADGKLSDDALRGEITAFDEALAVVTSEEVLFDAPKSTRRGLGKLTESVTEYKLAMSSLLDWLDSGSGGSRLTYRLTIGSANVHWDEGLINLYRAGQAKAPPLPHPQPKKK